MTLALSSGTGARRIAIVVGAFLALGVMRVPSADAGKADDYARDAVTATNAQRVAHGRRELGANACLKKMASKQATRMASQERMFHQPLGPIQNLCGMNWVGENVAYNYPTGAKVVAAWMASPEHRANILRGQFRRIGVGARKGANGVWYVSQVFGART
ncbi:CAP domain-containing protein [Nocardioides sp.]|uniref:CAP domain-containing protein n=1 Tax=Nocardioides sp. TaxID=35761 RepID=UPI0031FF2295|nr:hypothetical protein [Nocardioides sp.]